MSFYRSEFALQMSAARVRFGAGIRQNLAEEIDRLGAKRALILTTPNHARFVDEFREYAPGQIVGGYARATMHTPVSVSEDATAFALNSGADALISVGGGSTIGLGKAIAFRTDLPQIVIPTTYAGSEATGILGQTENGVKTTLTSPKVQPEVILYDPELVATLPVGLTVTSALNACAHAAEGLYARDRSPLSSLIAVEGLRAFRDSLPNVIANPLDMDARGETLYGAWLCGTVLGQVGMALHHKLCHTLGGSFGLPHAETHAVILSHALSYNAHAAQNLLTPISNLFGASPGLAVWQFAKANGAPMSLREIGMAEQDLTQAADLAVKNPYWNPAPIQRDGILRLLRDAWAGTPPTL